MPTAFMEFIKQPANLKDKKTMAAIIGTVLLLFALPLTVIGTLQFKEGTHHLKTKAAAPALDFGFPRISKVHLGEGMSLLKYMVASAPWSGRTEMKTLREQDSSIVGLRYFAGRAYQGDERSYPYAKIYPGHWLFLDGTALESGIDASTTQITVAADTGGKISAGDYVMIWNGTVKGAANQDDPNFWNNTEHAWVIDRNGDTLTVERGYDRSKKEFDPNLKKDHSAGSRIAQHLRGAGTGPEAWSYNVSMQAPTNPTFAKQFNQILGEWLGTHLNACDEDIFPDCPDTTLWDDGTTGVFNGYLFDTTNYWINGAADGRVDCDNDNVADGCVVANDSSWGQGLEVVFQRMREGLGPDIIIAGGVIESRGFDYLNGNQFEGFPGNFDMGQIDGDFARYESWLEKAKYTPRYLEMYSHFQTEAHKDPDCGSNPDCRPNPYPGSNKGFRYTLGMTMLDDGFYAYNDGSGSPGDAWWDEYAVDLATGEGQYQKSLECDAKPTQTERIACWKAVKDKTGYLGQPIGDGKYQRLFSPSPSDKIFEDSFESGISGSWSKTRANLSQAACDAPGFGGSSLRINPTDSGAVATLSSIDVEAGKEYTLKFWAKAEAIHDISVEVLNSVGGKEINPFLLFPTWKEYVITFTPTATSTSVRFKLLVETSDVFLDGVQIYKGGANKFRRDFEKGIVLVNGNSTSETFSLEKPFKRIDGTQDRGTEAYPVNNGALVQGSITLEPNDAIILLKVPDTEDPNASITEPASGATVSDTITITADATDNVGVTKVEFYVDTSTKIGEDSTSPYSISWNTNTVSNGSRSLLAKAYDAANNVGTSEDVSVTVNNGGGPLPPSVDLKANNSNGPITITYNTSATISWTSTNATSCSVSPTGWTGVSGSKSTGRLTAKKTYTLNCSGEGGSASDLVTVNVTAKPAVRKLGDLNLDGKINIRDLSILLSKWSTTNAIADLDKSGRVNIRDLSTLLSRWGR